MFRMTDSDREAEDDIKALAANLYRYNSWRQDGSQCKSKLTWPGVILRLFVKLRTRFVAFVAILALVLLFSVKRDMLPTTTTDFDDNNDTGGTFFIGERFTQRPHCDDGIFNTTNCTSEKYAGLRGSYNVLYNYVLAEQRFYGNQSVTFCTHATYHLLPHVEILCRRWRGPVSVAVYSPGSDFNGAMHVISFLRTCGHSCVRSLISFHLFYDKVHPPSNASNVPSYVDLPIRNCQTFSSPVLRPPKDSFKSMKRLVYPINVARNIARQTATTYFVLSADVELYPSRGIVPMFLGMMKRDDEPAMTRRNPKVFVLPIFEVASDASPPGCKAELVRLYRGHRAVFFHKYVCPRCAFTPRLDEWLREKPIYGRMRIFHIAKRHPPYHRWEPIYIGTKREPHYDERLTWEGRQDKMSQMHALCLLDYDLDVLDNGFLVHAPGIKKKNVSTQVEYQEQMRHNDKIHRQIVWILNKQYGKKKLCI